MRRAHAIPLILSAGVWTVVAGGWVAGCDKPEAPGGTALPEPIFGDGRITGVVRFDGVPPPRKLFPDSADCHEGALPVQDELLVVQPGTMGIRDVVVKLINVPASDGYDRPQLTLDQVGCQYIPHVLPVQVNQQVKLLTSDPVFHNVHWVSRRNGDVNVGLPRSGDFKLWRYVAEENLRLKCDVHPWMEAHVIVIPHPFFDATDAGGTFTIPQVPAGEYEIVAWHRLLGEQRGRVSVSAAGEAVIDFRFTGPG
jgi:hypothetical protein